MKQKLLFSRAAFLCALAVCAGLLAGCAAKADSAASFDTADTAGGQAGLSVVCTLFPVYDLVRAVGGGAVDAALLVSPGMDAHGYAPTAADMTAAAGADLLLCVGGHADEWAAGILDNIGEVRTAALLLHPMAPRGTEMVRDYMNFGEEFWDWNRAFDTLSDLTGGKDHALKFLEPKVDFFTRHPSQFADRQ